MNGKRRLVFVLAAVALVASVWLLVHLLTDDDGASRLKSNSTLATNDPAATGVRRSAHGSRGPRARSARQNDDWEPLDETEAEKQQVPVRVRVRIAETGKPLDGADVSLLATKEEIYRRIVHGRREEAGCYFFRLPQGYQPDGVRLQNGPAPDDEGAFVPGYYFAPLRELNEGFELEILVSQAPTITGVVVDAASGRPLPDAEILVHGGPPRQPWRTVTDEQGAFRLHALQTDVFAAQPDFLDLDVSARGHVGRELTIALAPGRAMIENLTIGLEPALRAAGVILDENGSVCPGLDLELLIEPATGRAPIRVMEALLATSTDDSGRFDFATVAAGRRLELRVEAEGFLPGRFVVDPLEFDRRDLRFVLNRGVRVGLDLVMPDGAGVDEKVVRVFSRDDRGDWYPIPLDVLSDRREVPVPETRPAEILVFVQESARSWLRGSCIVDPKKNLDRVTVPLAPLGDDPGYFGGWGLARECRWGVRVTVSTPAGMKRLKRVMLGSVGYYSEDVTSLDLNIAPSGVFEYRVGGMAPQRYLVTAEPGSTARLEIVARPAAGPERR